MLQINDDKSIYLTRGDAGAFAVTTEIDGAGYFFQVSDMVVFRVTEKKNCDNVYLEKKFVVEEECEYVYIVLEESDTKFGESISKPTDFWYEIELIPYSEDGAIRPQTVIGYDEDGAKILRLFPEGSKKTENTTITPEDIPIVDEALDATSSRPVQNGAIARAIIKLSTDIDANKERIESVSDYAASIQQEVAEERARVDAIIARLESQGL